MDFIFNFSKRVVTSLLMVTQICRHRDSGGRLKSALFLPMHAPRLGASHHNSMQLRARPRIAGNLWCVLVLHIGRSVRHFHCQSLFCFSRDNRSHARTAGKTNDHLSPLRCTSSDHRDSHFYANILSDLASQNSQPCIQQAICSPKHLHNN